jgi:lipopolysaccharide exporter
MIGRLLRFPFLRNLAVLSVGTAAGQGVAILASPLLTRIYDPTAFGIFGTFSAIVITISAAATLKYEQAIVVEKEKDPALDVLSLCLFLSIAIAIVTLLAVAVCQKPISAWVNPEVNRTLLDFAAASIFAAGTYNALQFLGIRRQAFSVLAIYQFSKSLLVLLGQYGAWFAFGGAFGLIAGQLAGQVLALVILLAAFRSDLLAAAANLPRIGRHWHMALVHRQFAIYGAPQSVMNAVAGNVPTLLLTTYFGPTQAGLFWMAYRILILPNMILIESVRSVLYQRIAQLHHDGRDLNPVLFKAGGLLFAVCCPIAVTLIIFGRQLFGIVFGAVWADAGTDAAILSWSWVVQNASVPYTVAAVVLGLQRQYFVIEFVALVGRVAALVVGGLLQDAALSLILFSGVGAIASLATSLYVWGATGRASQKHLALRA